MSVKLHQVPRGSIIKCKVKNEGKGSTPAEVKFHHLDGMYSYCTIVKPKRLEDEVVHLHRMASLTLVSEGVYKLED